MFHWTIMANFQVFSLSFSMKIHFIHISFFCAECMLFYHTSILDSLQTFSITFLLLFEFFSNLVRKSIQQLSAVHVQKFRAAMLTFCICYTHDHGEHLLCFKSFPISLSMPVPQLVRKTFLW
jgi:hypothetical protein